MVFHGPRSVLEVMDDDIDDELEPKKQNRKSRKTRWRPIPELVSEDEIKSMSGIARPGSHASRVTPQQGLQKAAQKTFYLIYKEALAMVVNGASYNEKQAGMKFLLDLGNGVTGNKSNANLKNQSPSTIGGVTNIQIRGVAAPQELEPDDDEDEDES